MKRSILLMILGVLASSCDVDIDGNQTYYRVHVTPNRVETDATKSYVGTFAYTDSIFIRQIRGSDQDGQGHVLAEAPSKPGVEYYTISSKDYYKISPENPRIMECEGISVRQTSPFYCTVSIEANVPYKDFAIDVVSWRKPPALSVFFIPESIYIYRNAGE